MWPNPSRSRLLELIATWAALAPAPTEVLVVFDGEAPEGAPDGVEVACSGRERADDVLVREAGERAARGMLVTVVTSDRGLRGRLDAKVECRGGGSFARELLAGR